VLRLGPWCFSVHEAELGKEELELLSQLPAPAPTLVLTKAVKPPFHLRLSKLDHSRAGNLLFSWSLTRDWASWARFDEPPVLSDLRQPPAPPHSFRQPCVELSDWPTSPHHKKNFSSFTLKEMPCRLRRGPMMQPGDPVVS
jgi:hypothetical protein